MYAVHHTTAEASVFAQSHLSSTTLDRKVIHVVAPDTLSDKDILTGEAYRLYAQDLSTFLLEDVSRPNGNITLSAMRLEHFYLEGRFDRVFCRLLQREEDVTCFEMQTSFFCNEVLVTTAE